MTGKNATPEDYKVGESQLSSELSKFSARARRCPRLVIPFYHSAQDEVQLLFPIVLKLSARRRFMLVVRDAVGVYQVRTVLTPRDVAAKVRVVSKFDWTWKT